MKVRPQMRALRAKRALQSDVMFSFRAVEDVDIERIRLRLHVCDESA